MSGELRKRVRADELRRWVARTLLEIDTGRRLPTVRDLAARYGASVGATQEALAQLVAEGAVVVDRRGRGTTLVRRSAGQLWAAAEATPLIISLPLPSTRRIEGLATAIKANLTGAGVEAFLVFSRGSRNRMLELREQRCHAVVMSALAAAELCGPDEETIVELPAQSFVKEHRVYVGDDDGMLDRVPRVVMDRDSLDFQLLTELEFGHSPVRYVPATYMQFPRLIAEHRADAVIWDMEEAESRMPSFVRDRPLSAPVLERIGDSDLRATFVVRRSDVSVRRILTMCLDPVTVMRVHGEVVEGRRVPEY